MSLAGCLDDVGVARPWREYGASRRWQRGTLVWCAEPLTATQGEAMALGRAQALNAVLAHCPLPVTPGEWLVGSGNPGRWVAEGTYAREGLAAAQAVVNGVGERGFQFHAKHHAAEYATLSRRGFAGLRRFAALIRTCFELGGQELQFNPTDSGVLRKAMGNLERYESLVVRVSGFSATDVHPDRSVQDDILARPEHRLGGDA